MARATPPESVTDTIDPCRCLKKSWGSHPYCRPLIPNKRIVITGPMHVSPQQNSRCIIFSDQLVSIVKEPRSSHRAPRCLIQRWTRLCRSPHSRGKSRSGRYRRFRSLRHLLLSFNRAISDLRPAADQIRSISELGRDLTRVDAVWSFWRKAIRAEFESRADGLGDVHHRA